MTLWSWIAGPTLRPDVEPGLARVALDRMRVFAPIQIIGVATALLLSGPAGVALPTEVLAINLAIELITVVLAVLLARNRVPLSWAHRVGAIIWLAAPVSTLASYVVTDQPTLVLPLMIGIATAALQV